MAGREDVVVVLPSLARKIPVDESPLKASVIYLRVETSSNELLICLLSPDRDTQQPTLKLHGGHTNKRGFRRCLTIIRIRWSIVSGMRVTTYLRRGRLEGNQNRNDGVGLVHLALELAVAGATCYSTGA